MIKGILLGISISVFIVSLIFTFSGTSGNLQENIITGNVIGSLQLTGFAAAGLIVSFVLGFFAVLWIRS